MATVLAGVRVFDGETFGAPMDVVIEGGSIVAVAAGSGRPAGDGGYLVPGFIDCHVHLAGPATQDALVRSGVTTALDMGSSPALVAALRGRRGVTDIRSSMMVMTAPTSAHAARMAAAPGAQEALVAGPAEAEAAVARRIEQGADYIKVVIDLPGFEQDTVTAIVDAAHARGLTVIAHASRSEAVAMAAIAGVDVITHVPLDRGLLRSVAEPLAVRGTVVVPTLTMMKAIADQLSTAGRPGPSYAAARESVAALHAAGMPILAGTDANSTPSAPASPPFGASLHQELELLVEAGLTPVEALAAATSVAADHFGLTDRGRIAAGLRADLVLLDADPAADITATGSIREVWVAGVRVQDDDS